MASFLDKLLHRKALKVSEQCRMDMYNAYSHVRNVINSTREHCLKYDMLKNIEKWYPKVFSNISEKYFRKIEEESGGVVNTFIVLKDSHKLEIIILDDLEKLIQEVKEEKITKKEILL